MSAAAAVPMPNAEQKVGLWLTGQVMIEPRYYPASIDPKTNEKKPETFAVTLFYGAAQNATMYLAPKEAAGLKVGDVVTVGPCRTGRTGGIYLVDR